MIIIQFFFTSAKPPTSRAFSGVVNVKEFNIYKGLFNIDLNEKTCMLTYTHVYLYCNYLISHLIF